MNRSENLRRLASEEFDLCIIGGGASGAGCALDASLRDLKVALIEKTDFAAETSSRSTKLVHGGVRYLEQAFKKLDFAQLRQVQHGLKERRYVLQNAPHLARPLGLLTPVFSWWEGLYYTIGLKLYDWFSGGKHSLPASRWLSKREALELMPGLSPRIHSAVLYYDGQLDDARYCLALVQSAAQAGAVVANHLELVGFQKDDSGKLQAAVVKNTLGDEPPFPISAKKFLNCTGPYADHIRQLANPDLLPRIRPSKGVHLVLPLSVLESNIALLIPKTRDGRIMFAIPFEGALLLGTTDEPYLEMAAEPMLEAREIDFLLESMQPFVAQKIEKGDIQSGFGGIRPLIATTHHPLKKKTDKKTKSLLRDHEVERDSVSGLLSLLGGKWTTYRLMASDAVDLVCREMGLRAFASTAQHVLYGAENYDAQFWEKLATTYGFDEEVCQHLAGKYGCYAAAVAALTLQKTEWRERILPEFPFLKAEVVYAVRQEMAQGIRDFLARRIRLESLDWSAAQRAAPTVSQLMAEQLGWTSEEQDSNTSEYLALLKNFIQKTKLSSAEP